MALPLGFLTVVGTPEVRVAQMFQNVGGPLEQSLRHFFFGRTVEGRAWIGSYTYDLTR